MTVNVAQDELIDFDTFITYTCNEDFYLEEDRSKTSFEVQCLKNNTLDEPNPWPRCLDSKISRECFFFVSSNDFSLQLFSALMIPPIETQWAQENCSRGVLNMTRSLHTTVAHMPSLKSRDSQSY